MSEFMNAKDVDIWIYDKWYDYMCCSLNNPERRHDLTKSVAIEVLSLHCTTNKLDEL